MYAQPAAPFPPYLPPAGSGYGYPSYSGSGYHGPNPAFPSVSSSSYLPNASYGDPPSGYAPPSSAFYGHMTTGFAPPSGGAYPYAPPPPPQPMVTVQPAIVVQQTSYHNDDEEKDEDDNGPLINEGKFGSAATMLIGDRLYCVKTPKTAGSFLPPDFVREVFLAQAFVDDTQCYRDVTTGARRRTSPFILPFRDVFFGPNHNSADQRPAIHVAYDYAANHDMLSWIKGSHPEPIQLFHTIILVLHGLRDLHEHGIVHGDFKPANVLITEGGWPYIADLGGAGVKGNVEPDIVDKYYSDPEHETRDQHGDMYAFMRLIQRIIELCALQEHRLDHGKRRHRYLNHDEFDGLLRTMHFATVDHRAILWYLYNSIVEQRHITAALLIEGMWNKHHFIADLTPPAAVRAAQLAFSPFTDEPILADFIQRHQPLAPLYGHEMKQPLEAMAQWHARLLQLLSMHFGQGDQLETDMAEYLVGESRDPVAVLACLSCHILQAASQAGVRLESAAILAAVQIATYLVGHPGKMVAFEPTLIQLWQDLNSELVSSDAVYQWQMAIVVGLWFGPVHKYLRGRWADGPVVDISVTSTRSLYTLPPPPPLSETALVVPATTSLSPVGFGEQHEQPEQEQEEEEGSYAQFSTR